MPSAATCSRILAVLTAGRRRPNALRSRRGLAWPGSRAARSGASGHCHPQPHREMAFTRLPYLAAMGVSKRPFAMPSPASPMTMSVTLVFPDCRRCVFT